MTQFVTPAAFTSAQKRNLGRHAKLRGESGRITAHDCFNYVAD